MDEHIDVIKKLKKKESNDNQKSVLVALDNKIDSIIKYVAELGITKINKYRIDRNNVYQELINIGELLMSIDKKLDERNTELKQIKKVLKQEIPNEISLTHQELLDLGITISSDVVSLADLSPEVRQQIDGAIGGMMLSKISKILEMCFTDEKLVNSKNLKDSSIALSALVDKLRLIEGKSTSNKVVTHDLTALISKNSKKMSELDVNIIDIDVDET